MGGMEEVEDVWEWAVSAGDDGTLWVHCPRCAGATMVSGKRHEPVPLLAIKEAIKNHWVRVIQKHGEVHLSEQVQEPEAVRTRTGASEIPARYLP